MAKVRPRDGPKTTTLIGRFRAGSFRQLATVFDAIGLVGAARENPVRSQPRGVHVPLALTRLLCLMSLRILQAVLPLLALVLTSCSSSPSFKSTSFKAKKEPLAS